VTRLALLALALCAATPAAAQVRPVAGAGDPRIQTVDYDAAQVVQIQAAPGYQVTLQFGADEVIENVAVGDSTAWQVSANRNGGHLYVKPLQPVPTNMTVVTNVRIYAFDLVPLPAPAPDMAYTVRFNYPAASGPLQSAEAQLIVEGRYRLSGEQSLRPSRISDDGQHTYIEFPREAAIPAIYAVDERGNEALVNGMMRDDLYVIDAVVPRLIFRIDQHVARATRLQIQQQTAR
jgi:type IV secretion system protein VirB9